MSSADKATCPHVYVHISKLAISTNHSTLFNNAELKVPPLQSCKSSVIHGEVRLSRVGIFINHLSLTSSC